MAPLLRPLFQFEPPEPDIASLDFVLWSRYLVRIAFYTSRGNNNTTLIIQTIATYNTNIKYAVIIDSTGRSVHTLTSTANLRLVNMLVKTFSIVAAYVLSVCIAAPTCPLEGTVFPKPLQLATSEAIKAAVSSLTDTFSGITNGAQNYSFALEVFSAHDPEPLFSVLHTAPNLATLNTAGVKVVDENTVFRLGSLTKIYTIYTFLINAGDKIWNEPITKFVPELQAVTNYSDPVTNTAWDEVTIGGLATQMTGIPRDCE